MHHMWHKALDDGLQVDAVFLDFAKAFDRLHHKILLNKLCNFGISGHCWNGVAITYQIVRKGL